MVESKQLELEFGLSEDWDSVVKTLAEIIPVYDKTNRYISFGTDIKIRNEGLMNLLSSIRKEQFDVLDLGCGTGKMSEILVKISNHHSRLVVLADALRPMLRVAKSRIKSDALVCVYENLPIRPESFDAAMAGFSLRDAKTLSTALAEIRQLLRVNGRFLIVDLSKPDSRIRRAMIGIYWKTLSPLIAFFAAGRVGLRFGELYKTYRRLPKNSEFLSLVRRSGFDVTTSKYFMLGGACFIVLNRRD
ncbi:MAG: class I SAM-dependent methyltransferase [Thaumarchaeota archaeon]|nr:class I SAM-dependent methyltransferase [Nitrososphaerota archaeon]